MHQNVPFPDEKEKPKKFQALQHPKPVHETTPMSVYLGKMTKFIRSEKAE